jgi:AcrR family transcriptional regulator
MDEIALEAGVGKGTVYYYFEDKEDIFLRVIEEEANELLERIRRAISEYENPVHQLQAFFVERVKSLSDLVNLRWLKFSGESVRWESLEKEELKLLRKEQEMVRDILEKGRDKGLFAFEDGKKLAGNLTSIITALDRSLLEGISVKELKRKIEEIVGMLVEGLRARKLKPEKRSGGATF